MRQDWKWSDGLDRRCLVGMAMVGTRSLPVPVPDMDSRQDYLGNPVEVSQLCGMPVR